MAEKVRPALVISVDFGDADRALVTIVPHTTSLRGSQFEIPVSVSFLKAGAFVVQGLSTYPHVRAIRKLRRKQTERHIPVNSLPEEDPFTRLCNERKHFIDTLKTIAYRAESSMASLLREHMARGGDDARALLRQIFQTEADLTPDHVANTLTVRLHHLTQAAHDQAIEQLLADLNATQTVFPGTQLTLVFKLGSS